MTELPNLGRRRTIPTGINNNGDVTGWGDLGLPEFAFLYRNGQTEDLGTLGGTTARANAISNGGYITGRSFIQNDSSFHAFRVNAGSSLPPLSGKIYFDARPSPAVLEIVSINPDGTNRTTLTTSGADYDPSVSADGSKIAFVSLRDSNVSEEIFIMNS